MAAGCDDCVARTAGVPVTIMHFLSAVSAGSHAPAAAAILTVLIGPTGTPIAISAVAPGAAIGDLPTAPLPNALTSLDVSTSVLQIAFAAILVAGALRMRLAGRGAIHAA